MREMQKEKKQLLKVGETLEKAGFKITDLDENLFIEEPIPNLVPHQKHHISLDVYGYFCIYVSFVPPELEKAIEPEDFDKALDAINGIWIPKLSVFFDEIYLKFNLDFDVELDVIIEYTLAKYIDISSSEEVLSIMQFLKERRIWWGKGGNNEITN